MIGPDRPARNCRVFDVACPSGFGHDLGVSVDGCHLAAAVFDAILVGWCRHGPRVRACLFLSQAGYGKGRSVLRGSNQPPLGS